MSFDSGYNLTYLASNLNLRAEKFTGFLNFFAGDDLTNLELKFLKIVKCDLWFCFNIDHVFLLLLPLQALLFRMKFFYFGKYFLEVKTCKRNLRFLCYLVS